MSGKLTRRENDFSYDLAKFICYPDYIEIGCGSHYMKDIIRDITKGNAKIREAIFDYCTDFVLEGYYDRNTYGDDKKEALNMMKEDYNSVFFKK